MAGDNSIVQGSFCGCRRFCFFITGNIETDSIRGLVETYLGGLPSAGQKENFKDIGIYPPKGIVKKHFNKKMENPKSTILVNYTGEFHVTLQNQILMDCLQSVLNNEQLIINEYWSSMIYTFISRVRIIIQIA